ncbi:MAG TPA: rhomboid family intramembrane serine protease [Moraxellaceae bacterium]
MFLMPSDHVFSWKKPPRLVLGLAVVLTLIFVFWHGADVKREAALDLQYRQELLATEWPLYETHLLKTGQRATLNLLKQARSQGDTATLARYIGADEAFVNSVRLQGKDYLSDAELDRWKASRQAFNEEHEKLSYEALGVDPEHFRPITFLTFNLVQPDVLQFVAALVLLLTAGMALELALGSGAVLAGFLGGGLAGALLYLMSNGANVLPLAGAGAASAGLTGMFLMHFRQQKLKYFGSVELSALLIGLLWLALAGAWYVLAAPRLPEVLAWVAGLASGPLWHVVHQRWFAHEGDVVEELPQASEEELDQAYREQLQAALDAIGRMEFADGQKRLRELVKSRPQDLRVLTQLYHLEKLDPASTTYDAVTRRLLQLATHSEEGVHTALATYRDYDKLSLEKRALDTETSLKLVIRFAKLGEIKDAEKLMKALLTRKASHALLPKAAHALAQACEQLHDPARAEQYRQMAAQG